MSVSDEKRGCEADTHRAVRGDAKISSQRLSRCCATPAFRGIAPRGICKEEQVRRVVVLVLASGVAFVLTLGAGVFDSNVGIAKARKCPPGSTHQNVEGDPVCTTTWVGTPRGDAIAGENEPRTIEKMYGRGGNDRLAGYGGKDGLSGGSGQDTLWGGSGGDGLFGDSGSDTIIGGPGGDEVWDNNFDPGGGGQDIISTGPGNDSIRSLDRHRDTIYCGPGKDWVIEEDKIDVLKDCEPDPGVDHYNYWWATLMGSPPS
jgi:RTX calcium-binding nonapeptide repeat (4 copies)